MINDSLAHAEAALMQVMGGTDGPGNALPTCAFMVGFQIAFLLKVSIA